MTEEVAERWVIEGRAGFHALVDHEVVVEEWQRITQEDVNAYARGTGDDSPAHTDPEAWAARGGTIVPGFMLLALTIRFFFLAFEVRGFDAFLVYGVDRVRFPHAVRVGERVRPRLKIVEVREAPLWGDSVIQVTMDREDGEKPACWVQWIGRGYETRTHPGPGCDA